jgi:fluoride ion exporter CrcB/FEX
MYELDLLYQMLGIFLVGGLGCCIRYVFMSAMKKLVTTLSGNNSQITTSTDYLQYSLPEAFRYLATSTLFINIIGCALIGYSAFVVKHISSGTLLAEQVQTIILITQVGLCGGISTLSTFAVEVTELVNGTYYKDFRYRIQIAAVFISLTIVLPILVGVAFYRSSVF